MCSFNAKSTGSTEVFTGPPLRPVEQEYQLLDQWGNSDEKWHKDYFTCLTALLNDSGVGDDIERLMAESDLRLSDDRYNEDNEDDVYRWFRENYKDVEALVEKHGYRVIDRLRTKERK